MGRHRRVLAMGLVAGLLGAGLAAATRSGPDSAAQRREPGKVDGAQARRLVAEGATLVDVRTPAEYRAGHIAGALNVPVDQLLQRAAELGDRDRPVVLYCRSGRRSALAARKLRELGFEQVYDLGPKRAW
jgi:phage shock protein E